MAKKPLFFDLLSTVLEFWRNVFTVRVPVEDPDYDEYTDGDYTG